jgi:uncharacterized protein (DUF433 family)
MSGATGNLKTNEERIIRDKGICGGEPVFKGTGVTLRTVLASLAAGDSAEGPALDSELPQMMVQMLVHQYCPLVRR